MKGYVLTRLEPVNDTLAITTRLYRDQWTAMKAAADEAGDTLTWTPPPQDDATHWEAGEYLLDELVMLPRTVGPRAVKVVIDDVDAGPNAKSVQFFEDGTSMGSPDTAKPFRKTWTRPAGQDTPVEIAAEVVYESDVTYRGVVLTID